MPHPHGFARSLFGDATVCRSATREARGAFIVALRRVVRAPTHTMSAISMSTVHVAGAVASARAPAASRGAVAATPARAQARSVGFVGGQEARRGLALRAARGRAARGARGFEVVAQAISEVRIPPARTAPARRSRSLASRRTRRSPSRSGARSSRGAPKPQPCKPRDSRRRARVGPRSRDASTARPRAPATPPAPSPRDARPSPPPARVPLEPRDDDRIRRARDTRTGFFRAPRTASRFIHTTLASIFFCPDAAP